MILLFSASAWGFGIAGTIIAVVVAGFVLRAADKVSKASDTVISHGVKIENLTNSVTNWYKEVKDSHENIVNIFMSETDPLKEDVKSLQQKVDDHNGKIIRIETHLKFKK